MLFTGGPSGDSVVNNLPANAGDVSLILGWRHGSPLVLRWEIALDRS